MKVWVTNLRRYPIRPTACDSWLKFRIPSKKNRNTVVLVTRNNSYLYALAKINQSKDKGLIQTRVQSVLSQHRIEATRSSTNRQGRQGNPYCRLIEKISQFLNIPALTTSIEPTALGIVEAEKASFARARKADRKHERCPGRRFVALGGEVPPN
jgi:hypothetical protein